MSSCDPNWQHPREDTATENHTFESDPVPGLSTRDYIAAINTPTNIDPLRTCLVLVDLQYAATDRRWGLGRRLAADGRIDEAADRFERIERLVVPNSKRLLEAFRGRGLRRLFVTVGSEVADYSDLPPQTRLICRACNNRVGEREHDVIDELKPMPNERVVNKITFSPFASTPIELILRLYESETLVLAGVTTNMCVEHTARDAADLGFRCIVVEDACATDSAAMHEASLSVIRRLYGQTMSTDDVLKQLEEAYAGTTATTDH